MLNLLTPANIFAPFHVVAPTGEVSDAVLPVTEAGMVWSTCVEAGSVNATSRAQGDRSMSTIIGGMIRGRFAQSETTELLARVAARSTEHGENGTPYTQADVESLLLYVYQDGAAIPAYDGAEVEVVDAIHDTLQGWTVDTIGANVVVALPPAAVPDGGVATTVELRMTMVDGAVHTVVWSGPTSARLSA